MFKNDKLKWWVFGGIVIVATNNVAQFAQNLRTGDPFIYGSLIIISILTLRDISIGGALK
jgi:hypothetical protein